VLSNICNAGRKPCRPSGFSEFHYDDAGADISEFIEIAGVAGTDVTGWSIVRFNGSNGAPYASPMTS
jgi:hypothetical protein